MQPNELPPLSVTDVEIAKRCEESLAIFTEEAFGFIDPESYVHGPHIDMMSEYCEAFIAGEIPRLLINIPPGHMKSIECSVMLNAWTWTKKERASKRFVGLSYREQLALRDAMKTRNLIRSDWYQQRWGFVGGLREQSFTINRGQDNVSRFENSEGGYRFSAPVSGVMGEGGDFVVFDDPHNVLQAESDDVLAKTIEMINLALPTRVRSKDGGILVIMQRLREADMSGDMIARGGELVHLCLPARYEKDHPYITMPKTLKSGRILSGDWRTQDGELLFPDLFPKKRLDDMKVYLGPYGDAGQFQQRPSPREGGMFQKKDFQIIDRLPTSRKIGQTVRGWDLGATKKAGSYTSGVKMSLYHPHKIVMEHVNRGQWSPHERDEEMKKTAEIDGKSIIQDVPQDPGQAGKSQKTHIAANLKGYPVRFSPETGDKETRADPLSSQAEAGNLFLLRGEWNQAVIDVFCLFPMGKVKDDVDAASRAYIRLIRKQKRPPTAPVVIGG